MNKVSTWLVNIIDKALPPTTDLLPKQLVEYQGGESETTILFPYGMYSNVSNDVLALMFFYGGNSENRVAIPGSFQVRPTLEQGEIAFFRPDGDALIKFANNGDIEISTSANVTVSCVDAEGNPSGDITATCVNATVTANGAIDLTTVNGDINLTSGANVNISGGTVTLTATAELELNGGQLVDINGVSITLN